MVEKSNGPCRTRLRQQQEQLVADTLRRHGAHESGLAAHHLLRRRLDVEAQLHRESGGPHEARRVRSEGIVADRPNDTSAQIGESTGRVHEAARLTLKADPWQRDRHGVDGKVAAKEVVDNSVTRAGEVDLPVLDTADMYAADVPGVIKDHQASIHCRGDLSPSRDGVTLHRKVQVANRPAQHRVAKSSPHEKGRDTTDLEEVSQPLHERRKHEAVYLDGRPRCDRMRAQ